jgi:hypothetical protein
VSRPEHTKLGAGAMKPGGYDPDWTVSYRRVAHLLRVHDPEGFILGTTLCGLATGNWPSWDRSGEPVCRTCERIAQRMDRDFAATSEAP